jgi:hypothetical protein
MTGTGVILIIAITLLPWALIALLGWLAWRRISRRRPSDAERLAAA